MGVNSLPKTVTRQRRGCDLNPGHTARASSTLPVGYRTTFNALITNKAPTRGRTEMRAQTQRDVLDLSVYAMILCLFVHLSVFFLSQRRIVSKLMNLDRARF